MWKFKNHYLLPIDGTGLFYSGTCRCDDCCLKNEGKKNETYYHNIMGGCLVHPNRKTVVPLAPEAICRQESKGDTHGWHWGDYAYALIWIIEAPEIEAGGMLQCVPHTSWDKKRPRINKYLCENQISTYSFESGDLYLLKTGTTLHRTVPLSKDATRIMLNMTYAAAGDNEKKSLKGDDRWWDKVNSEKASLISDEIESVA